ncbi:MAG TPA: glycosyltransferase family A protein [Actinomycetota bacterium]|nr:glycosyltransferase family A protein [Actinomycetota bacterium]
MRASVSVVIATRNRAQYLAQAIDSIRAQSVCSEIEIVVVDDCSDDETEDVIRKFGNSLRYMRTRRQVERGKARNLGVELATTPIVAFLDSDDRWMQNKLERQLNAAGAISTTAITLIDHKGATLGLTLRPQSDPELRIARCNPFPALPSTLVMPRQLFLELGGFPETREVQGSEDWVFAARILKMGHAVFAIGETLVEYRVHATNSSRNANHVERSMWEAVRLLEREALIHPTDVSLAKAYTSLTIANHYGRDGNWLKTVEWLRSARRHSAGVHVRENHLIAVRSALVLGKFVARRMGVSPNEPKKGPRQT